MPIDSPMKKFLLDIRKLLALPVVGQALLASDSGIHPDCSDDGQDERSEQKRKGRISFFLILGSVTGMTLSQCLRVTWTFAQFPLRSEYFVFLKLIALF